MHMSPLRFAPVCALAAFLIACSNDPETSEPPTQNEPEEESIKELSLTRQVPSEGTSGIGSAECIYASPLHYERDGDDEVIVTAGDVIVGIDAETGAQLWVVELPEPVDGERAFAAGTPAMVDDLLVVGYQTRPQPTDITALNAAAEGRDAGYERRAHHVAVVNLEDKAIDERFPLVKLDATIEANGGEVPFLASNAFGRSEIDHAPRPDGLGTAYVGFGNVRDIQPWHGWLFEIDLDAWQQAQDASAAQSAVFVTTPEPDCGPAGSSGSRERICGGGLWSPTGILVTPTDPPQLVLPAGNGQLDLARNDFANTLLKMPVGLNFMHGCDMDGACADFNPDSPSRACMESCDNLFIPRPLEGGDDPRPANGVCDGLSFFECWQQLDYIGGSTPAFVEAGGLRLLAYPTKDGHVYLVDFDDLGKLHDRHQLVEYCGTADDRCLWNWAGMIVAEPAVVEVDGTQRLLVPTFMPDKTHPAGVVALDVDTMGEEAELNRAWEFPNFSSAEAVERFRTHPTNIRVAQMGERTIAWLVEADGNGRNPGRLIGLDVDTGKALAQINLAGPGYRFTTPLVVEDRVFVNSCQGNAGPGTIEVYRLEEVAVEGSETP